MFTGFTPETVDFLWGIRMNNNREWFLEHKKQYTDCLYEPMKELGKDLFQPFLDKPGNILKVSRIYRDARMHHPLPYKESLWLCIRRDVEWWAENPCLFLEICPEGISCGFSFWHPRVTSLEAFRREIQAHPQAFLDLLQDAESKTGIPLSAESYKRPKPTEDPRLVPYISWKGKLCCIRSIEFGPDAFGPELETQAAALFRDLYPMYEYFNRFRP